MDPKRFGEALAALQAELDWARLGASYCEGDGREFFDDERRERVLDTGLVLAERIFQHAPHDGARRSLYVGAAVAELAPILAETLVLGREVVWLNLPSDEADELERALSTVAAQLALALPTPRATSIEALPPASFDHLWMVSVLTDPDAFPALHDQLYERSGGPLATGRGSLSADRARADELIEHWLDRAARPALVTTTDEELGLIEPVVRRRGGAWSVSAGFQESSLVGDLVRFCRWGA